MNNLTLWILSISGWITGIGVALLLVLFSPIVVAIFSNYENEDSFSLWQKIIAWTIAALVCFVVGFQIFINNTNASASWFRGLSAVESVIMKEEISKYNKPLTVDQFYNVKLSVQQNNHRQEQLNAMSIEK